MVPDYKLYKSKLKVMLNALWIGNLIPISPNHQPKPTKLGLNDQGVIAEPD